MPAIAIYVFVRLRNEREGSRPFGSACEIGPTHTAAVSYFTHSQVHPRGFFHRSPYFTFALLAFFQFILFPILLKFFSRTPLSILFILIASFSPPFAASHFPSSIPHRDTSGNLLSSSTHSHTRIKVFFSESRHQ